MSSSDSGHTELFRFSSQGLPGEELHVIRFSGQEGLNELFSFSIQLVCANAALDTGKLLGDRATFSILREDGLKVVFSGYPARVEQGGHFNGYSYYAVELRPTFWKMTDIVQSRIFLDQSLGDTIAELLQAERFFTFPHTFALTRRDYPVREFAMQYEESVYNYILRRLEDQGAYFYFSQAEEQDTVCFADGPRSHTPLEHTPTLRYSPVSGLEGNRTEEVLTSFSLSQTPLPRRVVIRTYSWTNPNKPVLGMADVSANGLGDVYLTGEDVETDKEAGRLAAVRAEELICRSRLFNGAGSVPGIRPGYTFQLEDHYNSAFNQEYLVTFVNHEGSQESFLNLGLGIPLEGVRDHLFYRNSFTCMETRVPFRPERKTPRATIAGVLTAFVDGEGSGARPELDALGRYKLRFPFDVSGRKNGNASCWIRMSQQQAGKRSGTSFPLLPGTEVLVSFADGNPDRPYITGALNNAETGALTGNANRDFSGISSAGGNQIVFNDTEKGQGMALKTAGGDGLVLNAGSASLGSLTSDFWCNSTGMAATNLSGALMSSFSGYRNAQVVGWRGTRGQAIWMALLQSVGSLGSTAMSALAGSYEDHYDKSYEGGNKPDSDNTDMTAAVGLTAGVGVLKSLLNVLEIFCVPKPTMSYGLEMQTTPDVSSTVTQIYPDKTKLTISLLGTLAEKAGLGAEIFSEEDSKDQEVAQEISKENRKDYEQASKRLAIWKAGSEAVADLAPEIIAWVYMLSAHLKIKKEQMGGVLLNAPEANITLAAKNAVGVHSEHGILLNTRLGEFDPVSTDSAIGKMLGPYAETAAEAAVDAATAAAAAAAAAAVGAPAADPDDDTLANAQAKARNARVKKWGTKNTDLEIPANLFNFYDKEAMAYTLATTPPDAILQAADLNFLAAVTKLLYTDAEYLAENVQKVRKALAHKHIYVSKNSGGQSALVIQNEQTAGDVAADQTPQAPAGAAGIYLTSSPEEGVIRLDTPKATITLNTDGLKLEHKAEKKPVVTLNSGSLNLQLDGGSSSINMTEEDVTIKRGSATIVVKDGEITMANSGQKFSLGQFTFTSAGEMAHTGSLSLQDGAIKIV